MKKKMALLLAAALTMTTILTGCGGGNEENADKQSDVTAEDAKEENASGDSVSEGGTVFTVGFDAEYPPYGYMDENGEYTGFDLELAQAVCDPVSYTHLIFRTIHVINSQFLMIL